MADQAPDILLRVGHRRPVRRIIDPIDALPQFLQARDIRTHFAVGWNHDGGRPAHHVVAAEQGVTISEAEMVGGVPGRRDGGHIAVIDLDTLAVGEDPVRGIIAIECSVGARADRLQRQRRAADDRRAGRLGQRPCRGTVVAVGVGTHDCRDLAPSDRLIQRIEMLGQVGSGIDHRDLFGADQVGLGAVVSEGRGIMGEHPGDPGRQLLELAIWCVHVRACATGTPRLASTAGRRARATPRPRRGSAPGSRPGCRRRRGRPPAGSQAARSGPCASRPARAGRGPRRGGGSAG